MRSLSFIILNISVVIMLFIVNIHLLSSDIFSASSKYEDVPSKSPLAVATEPSYYGVHAIVYLYTSILIYFAYMYRHINIYQPLRASLP